MAQHGFTSLMRRLSDAGFKPNFARVAVLPDWWAPACDDDASLLPEVEIRVARFIGAPLDLVRDPAASLTTPTYERAHLRRVRDISPRSASVRDTRGTSNRCCGAASHGADTLASAAEGRAGLARSDQAEPSRIATR